MKLIATRDISKEIREQFKADCKGFFSFDDDTDIALLSAEPPTWINIVGDMLEWITPLKVVATVFFSQLAKNAADDVWKNKSNIAKVLKIASVHPLKKLSEAILRLKQSSRKNTEILIGLPIPDQYRGTMLNIPCGSIEEVALALALFLQNIETITEIVTNEVKNGNGPSLGIQLIIRNDNDIILRWQHHKTLLFIEKTIKLNIT